MLALAGLAPASSSGAPEFPRELVLHHESVPYVLDYAGWYLAATNAPLVKEPPLGTQGVCRKLLRFGNDTNNAFALLWDQPRGRLYLDLNQNQDLTDDAAGVFAATDKLPAQSQTFTNVALTLRTASGLHPVVLDLSLRAEEPRVYARLSAHSLWQTKLDWQGTEWEVAVAETVLDGTGPAAQFLLLRPWATRTNGTFVNSVGSGFFTFPAKLFWQGGAFRLGCRFETRAGAPVCKLDFTPLQPPLVDLNVSGEFLGQVVLRAGDSNGYTVVLDQPHGTVKVPQDNYTVAKVGLTRGSKAAYRLPNQPLAVNASAAASLALGGPLTNSVTMSRQGRELLLLYRLVGADGGAYGLASPDREHPPEFAIHRGAARLAADKFRYG
jgi:hypothetical protein